MIYNVSGDNMKKCVIICNPNSGKGSKKEIIKEFISFVTCRLFSGILDIGSFYWFVTILGWNDIISKVIISVLVVILNYVFSKIFIFKNKNNENEN